MRKIAWRGLFGRKRDTALLWAVVALAFLFLALSTTLITSLQATDAAQRVATYGAWQVMAATDTASEGEVLTEGVELAAAMPMINVTGGNYTDGDNSYCLGVYTPALEELGRLKLREGRWPQARNEVVLEYARMAALDLEVGDTITVLSEQSLAATEAYIRDKQARYDAAVEAEKEELRVHYRALYDERAWETIDRGSGVLDWLMADSGWDSDWRNWSNTKAFFPFWTTYYESMAYLFADADHPEGRVIPLEELTEEQFMTALELYLDVIEPDMVAALPDDTVDLLGEEELMLRVRFSNNISEDNVMALHLQYTYTVCGVVETYSDRWDSGRLDLPRGFVTPENYQLLLEGQKAVLEKYPYFHPVEFPGLTLLSGGADASAYELWRGLLPEFDRGILAGSAFTRPVYEMRARELAVAPDGQIESLEGPVAQISFSFTLAHRETPTREETETVTAWLVPGDWQDWGAYFYDAPIGEAQGEQVRTVAGSLSDLVEREEDVFELRGEIAAGGAGWYDSVTVYADLEESTVVFDHGGERYELPLADFLAGDFAVGDMVPVTEESVFLESLEEPGEFDRLRVNRFAYPSSAEGTGDLLLLVMGILFVTTLCAVFQICFTQTRRRLRRIVLLKSLGAETGQVASMLGWEFVFFWLTALPAGALAGLAGAWAAVRILGSYQGRSLLLTIDPAVLLTALAMGTAALLLGMAVPAVMAAGVPLTGRTARKKPLPPPRRERRQTFPQVALRGLVVDRGRTIGGFGLCAFMMLIAVLCLFLGFRLLGEYRETVVRSGKPDYLLRAPYAMSVRQREEYLTELKALGVCGEIESYVLGEDLELTREAWEGSPLAATAASVEEDGALRLGVNLWCITPEDPLFARYNGAAAQGALTPESFAAHRDGSRWDWDVLVMVPLYRDTGRKNESTLERAQGWERVAASGIHTSYLAEYDGVYNRDTALQVGDVITLKSTVRTVAGERYEETSYEVPVTVGAILYYFPDTGIWPVSGSGEGYQIVADTSLLPYLRPGSLRTRSINEVRAISMSAGTLHTTEYGLTDFYTTAAEGLDTEAVDTELLVFARSHLMDIEVYHESSEKLLRDAVNNILLCCLMGMTAVLLALVIFYNTIAAGIEQERGRIGILQALGVTFRQLLARQLLLGLVSASIAVALSNALLWGGTALYAALAGKVLGNLLWGYPWQWHAVLCFVMAAALALLYALPMRRLRRSLPIENIKSRK